MKRFFVEPDQIQGEEIRITGSDVNHIKNVLRMKEGDDLWISAQDHQEYNCRIRSLNEEEILLEVIYVQDSQYELPGRICLFQALPKGDKMEYVIQKAVELGVHEIVPVATARCVVKLDEKKAAKKTARWQQIAQSAAEQSKRMRIPAVSQVLSYDRALEMAGEFAKGFIPYEKAENMAQTGALLRAIQPGEDVAIFIGPEGGFTEEEIEKAQEAGMAPITLGKRILRTETAGLAILSVLMFQLEEAMCQQERLQKES